MEPNTILALWIFVVVCGALLIALMIFVAWQGKGAATKTELHQEVSGLEKRVEERFEGERNIARDANSKIYNRVNELATGVAKVDTKMDEHGKLLNRIVDQQFEKNG